MVLKDIWVNSDRAREGNIITSLHAAADEEDKQLIEKHFLTTICHGDVRTELDIVNDTANALMRGLNNAPDHDSLFQLQRKPIVYYGPPFGSEGLRAITHKTHYRIVFKEICITVDRMWNLPGVMKVLTETVSDVVVMQLYVCCESWDGCTVM